MKAEDVLRLDEWVKKHRQQIMLAQHSQVRLAQQASDSLQCKVSSNAMRDVLKANGIARMTQAEREKQVLTDRVSVLEALLLKVVTATSKDLPQWLRDELLNEDLTTELVDAIKSRWSA